MNYIKIKLLVLLTINFCYSDLFWSKEISSLDSAEYYYLDMIKTNDGNFISVNETWRNRDVRNIKQFDKYGNVMWSKFDTTIISSGQDGSHIIKCNDNGYILTGRSNYPIKYDYEYITKYDFNHNKIWENSFYANERIAYLWDCMQISDNSYIAAFSYSLDSALIRKISSEGITLWEKLIKADSLTQVYPITSKEYQYPFYIKDNHSFYVSIMHDKSRALNTYIYEFDTQNGDIIDTINVSNIFNSKYEGFSFQSTDSIVSFGFKSASVKHVGILSKELELINEFEFDFPGYHVGTPDVIKLSNGNYILTSRKDELSGMLYATELSKKFEQIWIDSITLHHGESWGDSKIIEDESGNVFGITNGGDGINHIAYDYLFTIIPTKCTQHNTELTFNVPKKNASDSLYFYPIEVPTGMVASKNGVISWIPDSNETYLQKVTYEIKVNNSIDNIDTLTFYVQVEGETTSNTSGFKNFEKDIIAKVNTGILSFYIPSSSLCSGEIYNLKGQRIMTLFKNKMLSGKQSITLKKFNISGGIYFIKLYTKDNEIILPYSVF